MAAEEFHYKRSRFATRLFSDRLQQMPEAAPYMLLALNFWLEEPKRVVLAGDANVSAGKTLLHAAHAVYQPSGGLAGQLGLYPRHDGYDLPAFERPRRDAHPAVQAAERSDRFS